MFNDAHERKLMKDIAEGNAMAFEKLYAIYVKPISTFLYRLCYDRALTEDCVQEIFMRIWKTAPKWRGECKVSTFIFQVAKNYGLTARDKASRERTRLASTSNDNQDDNVGALKAEPEWQGPGPDELLEGSEIKTLVQQAVETLTEDQRIVVHLAQTDGLTYREVAEILSIPLGTVKSRMAAAAEALRRKLEKHMT